MGCLQNSIMQPFSWPRTSPLCMPPCHNHACQQASLLLLPARTHHAEFSPQHYSSTPYALLCWRCSTAVVVGTTSAATTVVASGPNSSTVTKVDMGGPNPPPLPVLGAIVRLPSPPCDHAARPPVPQGRWVARLASPWLATLFQLVWTCRGPLVPRAWWWFVGLARGQSWRWC
jgi:hypothetical protein